MPLSDHRNFFGLSSFEMLAMFRRGLFYAYLSIYLRQYLGLSVTETTLFATLPMVVNILCQTFIWGRLSDRFQLRRTLIVIGEIVAGVGTILVWYVHRKTGQPVTAGYVIIIGLSIIEIFWSMSNIAWSALISDVYDETRRSLMQGRLYSLGGLGRMAGIWIGGLLYDGLGARYAGWGFHGGGLFFAASIAMWVSTLPLLFLPEGGVRESPQRALSATVSASNEETSQLFVLFLISMVFVHFGRNSIAITLSQYLSLPSGIGVSSRELSYIFNTQSAAMILCGWATGWISSRLGEDIALMLSTVVGIIALIILAQSTWLPFIYLSNFLRGLGDVVIMATSYTYASLLIPPEKRGRMFALFNATLFLSWGLAGTLLAGPMVDTLIARGKTEAAAYRLSFWAAAGITLVGLGMQVLLKWKRRPKNAL